MTLAELIAYRTELRKVRYSGVLSLKHGDTTTTWRNDADIYAALRDLDRQIAALEGGRQNVTVATFDPD